MACVIDDHAGGDQPLREDAAVARVDERERVAGLSLHDGVELEAADGSVDGVVEMRAEELSAAEGQVVEEAADEDVALVEAGVSLVEGVVVDVELADGVEAKVAVGVVDVVRPGVGGGEREASWRRGS